MIKELRERGAKVVQPRPIQVAQDQALLCLALSCFDQRHLRRKTFPTMAVVNESVDPLPELRVHRVMELSLPPKIKWQIRIELRKDNVWEETRAWPFEKK